MRHQVEVGTIEFLEHVEQATARVKDRIEEQMGAWMRSLNDRSVPKRLSAHQPTLEPILSNEPRSHKLVNLKRRTAVPVLVNLHSHASHLLITTPIVPVCLNLLDVARSRALQPSSSGRYFSHRKPSRF